MPDLNQRNPLVTDYLVQNTVWWIEFLGLRGLRADSLPYSDKQFVAEWVRRITREYPAIGIIGDEWSENPAVVAYWQRGKLNSDGFVAGVPQLFDAPLRASLSRALASDPAYWDGVWLSLYELLATDFLYANPQGLVILPDNHDVDRIYALLGEDLDLYKMALVFFATMRGIPQFYYGTEVLASHDETGGRGDFRSDFPGGWIDDAKNAFTGEGLDEDEIEAQSFMRKLLNWRKENPTVHSGEFMHFAPIGNVYVYFRYDDASTVMVILNRDDEPITLETDRFAERIGNYTHATEVMTGHRYEISDAILLEPRAALILEFEH
jgi:glycosidase